MSGLHLVLLATAGLVLLAGVRAEVFDEACYELGKQWVYEAKDMLLCDRSGRRVNINKYCKAHLTSASGRLIIDNSKDDLPSEPKKQQGHFPELCLPGQRSYALQAPWLCTCVMHKGRHRWECVVPEGGGGRGLGSDSPNSSSRLKRSVEATTPVYSTTSFDVHDEGHLHEGHLHEGHLHEGHNGTGGGAVRGRQANVSVRPNIVIDFCDEFGYVHSISSSIKECACDKDIIATKLFSFKDNDLYQSSGLFSTYECLPGTYNMRCEMCYPDTHTCQPTPCP